MTSEGSIRRFCAGCLGEEYHLLSKTAAAPVRRKNSLTLVTVEPYNLHGFTQSLCHVQAVWVNMSTFYLSDDCSLWARNGPQSGIGVFLAAGSTLQNSVTLNMDQGGATVKLPLVDKQDTRREFPSSD